MPSQKWVKSNVLSYTSAIYQVVGDLLAIIGGLQIIEWKLVIEWSWTNQGISLVDLIYLGAYELIELDTFAFVACYEMIEWINWLVIKFGLIWVG